MAQVVVLAGLVLCATLLYRLVFARSTSATSKLPLPPSPPGDPILGHFRQIPVLNPEYAYIKWGKELDTDVLYFNVLGRHIVVLNSVKAANDLLDKRGANYADRPRFALFELMGWGVTLTFLRAGPLFRLHRTLLQTAFTPTAITRYRPVQASEAHLAVARIRATPSRWSDLANTFATAVVLRIAFGLPGAAPSSPYIAMADAANHATTNGGTPAASAVDYFPALRHLPAWLTPAASPLAHARRSRPAIRALHDGPWDATVADVESGRSAAPSFMRTQLEALRAGKGGGGGAGALSVADIKGAAGAITIAGGNTTWSTIVLAVLSMLMNRRVQRKAQAELDAVLCEDGRPGEPIRLPTFEDRERLPYLDLCVQEVYRWAPLSPVGVPHASVAEDEYRGWRIPAGSVVYANAQAMTHDPEIYSEPEKFNPDRFLPVEEGGREEPLPQGPFGFGRRVCPGKHLATAGVFIVMATMLATMDIVPKVGEDGKEIPVTVGMSNGLSSHPDHFEVDFKPRSKQAEELLKKVSESDV
ncbi:putative cytochrome p450 protein [Neofusicoccum parvum]|uniref:Cytochrome p450 protein n=1 Tax=Neofusicoccum parvum TaxID=310453 RepID=A0ACB5SD09_9PEZI|nr:putative cytochrome p450 protein [Neofusicoccum parvum]